MAPNEQIQQAINAATNAGAAHGYAQALEDVVGNIRLMAGNAKPDGSDILLLEAIRHNIEPELEKRKVTAERELRFAAASQAQLRANSPTWQVALARRIIDASRLRPLLVQALGGAVPPKPGP